MSMSDDEEVARAALWNENANKSFKAGDTSLAAARYSAAIAADPTVAKYWSNRANAYSRLGRYEDALTDADTAIAIDPTWLKGHYFRALALEKLGRLSGAVKSYMQASQLDPSRQYVKEAMSRCLATQLCATLSSAAQPSSSASNQSPPNNDSSNGGIDIDIRATATAAGMTTAMWELEGCGALSTEQKFSKARQLCDDAVAAWRRSDEDRAMSLLTAGAFLDVEAGLPLIPNNPDLLYSHATLLRTLKWDTLEAPERPPPIADAGAKAKALDYIGQFNMRTKQQRMQTSQQVLSAYARYLRNALVDHIYMPHAHYHSALILLKRDMYSDLVPESSIVARQQQLELAEAVFEQVEALYQAGLAADADLALLHGKYDIAPCSARAKLPAMLQRRKLRAYNIYSGEAAAEGCSSSSQGGKSNVAGNQSASAGHNKAEVKTGSTASKTAAGKASNASADGSTSMVEATESSTKATHSSGRDIAGSSSSSTTAATAAVPASANAPNTSRTARAASRSKPSCASCGVTVSKTRRCSGCNKAVYCSRECQVADWKEHKKVCNGERRRCTSRSSSVAALGEDRWNITLGIASGHTRATLRTVHS